MAAVSAIKFHRRLFSANANFLCAKIHILPNELIEQKEEDHKEPTVRYTVCRDRPAEGKKFTFPKSLDEDDCKMEAGFGTENEVNLKHMSSGQMKTDESSANTLPAVSGGRNFAVSTTYKNVVLPLKLSKLANPFPSPVKIMPSHTVSDQEKAEQMYQERRMMQKTLSSIHQNKRQI